MTIPSRVLNRKANWGVACATRLSRMRQSIKFVFLLFQAEFHSAFLSKFTVKTPNSNHFVIPGCCKFSTCSSPYAKISFYFLTCVYFGFQV